MILPFHTQSRATEHRCRVYSPNEMWARRQAREVAAEMHLSDSDTHTLTMYAIGRVAGETDMRAPLLDIRVRARRLSMDARARCYQPGDDAPRSA